MSTLYLIPSPLGDAPLCRMMPPYNSDIIRSLRHFIVENVRTARRFLKQVDNGIDIDSLTFYELNRHTDRQMIASYLTPMSEGCEIGIISEAGCPAVADPGADVVAIAQEKGYKVVPLVGPSSILMSLMASGFNGQSFAFVGYLPIDRNERAQRLKALERRAYSEDQTQIFIETPYRNVQLFGEMLRTLQPQTRLCIALSITTEGESIRTMTVSQWKKAAVPDMHKQPCIFLIYK
ncbi:MAG: SAM-dependent methyltransferase [bacterium]|uniref:SAM-dependent methyltransferase n=1 Tax=Candidatus Aphodosoma intestinipullorum TaxID=2840674 RepID=A0A940DMM2_9BACT|nr:SAM-dependent methyltransferase [Candidatus Aphodosoma intestinipullorum]